MRLRLICHAATAATRGATFPHDEPIEARAFAKLAALPVSAAQPDACWTSPARRATQTADALRLATVVEPLLRDCDYGRWAGRQLEDVQAAEPDGFADWLADPAAAPHGGESVQALLQRVTGWLETLRNRSGRLVAVTHAAVVRAAIVQAIEGTPRSFWRIDIAPLAVATLSGDRGRWSLASITRLTDDAG